MDDPFCYFYRNTGQIVYHNLELTRNIPHSNLNRHNCEVIHSKNVFTDGISYYYLTELYTENLSPVKNRYLKWQQTRNKDWDWFNITINHFDLINIQRDTSEIKSLITKNKQIQKQNYINELIQSMTNISDKYKIKPEIKQTLINTIHQQLTSIDYV